MRSLALVALLLLAGCGNGTTKMPDMMAAVGPDMSAIADMQKLSCLGLISCEGNCASANTTCLANCQSSTSTQGIIDATALSTCLEKACTTSDGGTPPCSGPTDQSPGCTTCEQTALAGACSTQAQACFTD
jgi:hypothetical protein